MREEEITNPNPRQQILTDLLQLIKRKRAEGYISTLAMDANGDYNHKSKPDIALRTFIQEAGLMNPYHMRFPSQICTYMYGKRSIDYILMNVALEQTVAKIGYLASHEGKMSDHVYAFVDLKEKESYSKGLYINR